jgi:hypothetical protein
METKICTKCNAKKSIDDYYYIKPSKHSKKGYYYNYCKHCHYHKMTKHTAKKWRKQYPTRWKDAAYKAQKAMFERDFAAVYLLITTKGWYVGSTDKFRHRMYQHKFSKFKGNMCYIGAKVLYTHVLGKEDRVYHRRKLEKYWIQMLRPRLNKHHNPLYKKLYHGGYEKK